MATMTAGIMGRLCSYWKWTWPLRQMWFIWM